MFRFKKIKREVGAGQDPNDKRIRPPPPNRCRMTESSQQPAGRSCQAALRASAKTLAEPSQSRKPWHFRVPTLPAFRHTFPFRTLAYPWPLSWMSCIVDWSACSVKFQPTSPKRDGTSSTYSPEAPPRTLAALSFPSPQGFPAAITISCSRNPAKLPTRYPLYNQTRTCCAAPYSITDRTPRRWPWTKHCHRWVSFPPTRWQGHLGGIMSPRDSRGVSPRCRPSGHVSDCAQSFHQCEPTLSLFSQVEDSGGAA